MTTDRIEQIERVIAECEAKGIAWTNLLVYEEVGGQYQAVSRYLKRRRALDDSATIVAGDEDPEGWADEHPQDTLDVPQEHDESDVQAGPSPEPLPSPEEPDDPCVPVEAPPLPTPITKLEALQQAVREADATLIRLTRERDVQQAVAQAAALALHQAKRDAHRGARALRAAAQQAQATPAPYDREAEARVRQLQGHLAALVGESDAQRIAHDRHWTPAWLRG